MEVKRPYKILRTVAVSVLALAFLIPAGLYVALSLPSVQHAICGRAEHELSELLGVDVDIHHVSITPFNRVTLHDIRISDVNGASAIGVSRLGAGLSLWSYVTRNRIELSYAEIIGLDARIYRDSVGAPLNIQPIIDALAPKDKSKPPAKFDFRINTVVLRTSSVAYDVLSEPSDSSRFDPSHIFLSDIRADIQLPQIKNDDFIVELRRLALKEHSGFTLENLSGYFHVAADGIQVRDLRLELPATHLAFNPMSVPYASFDELKTGWKELPVEMNLMDGSYVSLSDFDAFVPAFGNFDMPLDMRLHVLGNVGCINVEDFSVYSSDGLKVEANGFINGIDRRDAFSMDFPVINFEANASRVIDIVKHFAVVSDKAGIIVGNLGDIVLDADLSGDAGSGTVKAVIKTAAGNVDVNTSYERQSASGGRYALAGNAGVDNLSGETLFAGTANALQDIGALTADVDYDLLLGGVAPKGHVNLTVAEIVYKGHSYTDILANVNAAGNTYSATVDVNNPGLTLNVDAEAELQGKHRALNAAVMAHDVDLAMLGLDASHPDYRLSMQCDAAIAGTDIDNAEGFVRIADLAYVDNNGNGLKLDEVALVADRSDDGCSVVTLSSDIVDGKVEGCYRLTVIDKIAKAIVAGVLPGLTGDDIAEADDKFWSDPVHDADLTFDMSVKTTEPLESFIKLPVKVIYPIMVNGGMNTARRHMSVNVDAPYLQQGNKLIEGTVLNMSVDGVEAVDGIAARGGMLFTTVLPTKKGAMTLSASAAAVDNQVDTQLRWKVDRERNFSGDVNLSTRFSRDDENRLVTRIFVNPSELVFNDTVWTVEPATIDIAGKHAEVHDFRVGRSGQYISIEGRASESPADSIILTLEDVNLDYIFETLDISNAMFGGNATGKFYATELFTKSPRAYTPGLFVKRLSYNHSLMGDTHILSEWIPETKAIDIKAEVEQPNGRKSYIDGQIKPMADSLDMHFDADKIEIGFLKPFMSAFATDVSGYASGKARLWGSFKLIDMVGDIYGEDVKLTLGFTNTSYTTTDSVHLTPGRINIDGITISDIYGNKARLDGWVTHECFKKPRFNFRITDARNMLVYDVRESADTRWFGRVFGNGGATVNGEPGVVNIGVDIVTAPNSTFTFVLSDELNAQDYNFITFRDRDRAIKDSIAAVNAPPPVVRELKQRMAAGNVDGPPSTYNLNIAVDVTPQALVTLVMDPVGGDRIRANGHGNLRMSYDSANEDLRMNGTYTVERGSYNFTLQDIIIKDFTIKDGSSIAFHGDPYAAELGINAFYAVNANLSDLDESFLADKDLNRTNVPVHALMMVSGDMRQPDIKFDLEFPTLTQDTYRKVRSIVNTEEMMNRQIIYLLALNRFYTPDYMTTTKGNELVSVASSTISSQLSSMLGQLSDNWNIAPNFRSDRGDFSDVEVDLALSSHLLNNRLLFNGNFGYRDKALNNNSFVGDFDIEYLLNRSGTIRLKAYNRYNDQNYYVKSALTTQGVGIMFKRDFDDVFSFLRPWLRKRKSVVVADTIAPADTTATVTAQPQ